MMMERRRERPPLRANANLRTRRASAKRSRKGKGDHAGTGTLLLSELVILAHGPSRLTDAGVGLTHVVRQSIIHHSLFSLSLCVCVCVCVYVCVCVCMCTLIERMQARCGVFAVAICHVQLCTVVLVNFCSLSYNG